MRHLTHRARLLVVTLLAAVGLVAGGSPAWAGPPAPHHDGAGTYLALGDSVPFGYIGGQPFAFYNDITHFTGYPEIVARHEHLRLLNASCPGETTDSFIDVAAISNGCTNRAGVPGGYRDAHPLHVQYASRAQSQLQYAVAALRAHPHTTLVSIMLGANDGFLCQAAKTCLTTAGEQALAAHVRSNLSTILRTLRTAGGYHGQIVVVTYYALNYADQAGVTGTLILNSGIARAALANRASVASGFLAFLPVAVADGGGDTITAGLVYPGDVHPTPEGQALLARAVQVVARV